MVPLGPQEHPKGDKVNQKRSRNQSIFKSKFPSVTTTTTTATTTTTRSRRRQRKGLVGLTRSAKNFHDWTGATQISPASFPVTVATKPRLTVAGFVVATKPPLSSSSRGRSNCRGSCRDHRKRCSLVGRPLTPCSVGLKVNKNHGKQSISHLQTQAS